MRVPALHFVAGDTTGDGALSKEVFRNEPHLLCTKSGNIVETGKQFDGPNLAVQVSSIATDSFLREEDLTDPQVNDFEQLKSGSLVVSR